LNPYRVNYNALHPTGESRWESLAENVVKGIDVSLNALSLGRNELGAPYPPSTIGRMAADGLQVQEGDFEGRAPY